MTTKTVKDSHSFVRFGTVSTQLRALTALRPTPLLQSPPPPHRHPHRTQHQNHHRRNRKENQKREPPFDITAALHILIGYSAAISPPYSPHHLKQSQSAVKRPGQDGSVSGLS